MVLKTNENYCLEEYIYSQRKNIQECQSEPKATTLSKLLPAEQDGDGSSCGLGGGSGGCGGSDPPSIGSGVGGRGSIPGVGDDPGFGSTGIGCIGGILKGIISGGSDPGFGAGDVPCWVWPLRSHLSGISGGGDGAKDPIRHFRQSHTA